MKVIARNKRATFDYDLQERMVAGIVLHGHEVKSVRRGDVSLTGAFATIKDGELWLHNAHIGAYQPAALQQYDPTKSRKLLVRSSQLKNIIGFKQRGLHIVPVGIGAAGKYLKVEIGIGPSKKRRDKREQIKRKDTNIDMQRTLKQHNRSH
jgi:SsrA-binding protein